MDLATLRNIAAFAPILADPDFETGAWTEPRRSADGVITMPWFRLSEPASAFVTTIAKEDVAAHYLAPVDDEARIALMHMVEHPSAIADASVEQIGWILTYVLRADRFTERSLARAFDTGLMRAIAERAAVLGNGEPT
ncbi:MULTISPECIES: DUF6508 domain-containing protein [Sphingomonas]|jgi:hypothetical protein|uniref:Uncharacterized protein n=1 Tax=Sphingomonas zeae TaxID=1646122 RepID=A0A7Y6EG01_9SPHN|nr:MULTISPECIES: DUF6508 domain-containing protein [Sphingomonas]MBB4050123.1 hypothetical protein [Sphingomonas zeae]MDK8188281.1 DUF6508 domain-containing protein [Sphingomonas zeae]MDK8218168.1 DUF6508 domain-containing protein [Sphingomonas sp. UMB7805-LC452B]NUU45592.1 hypothetical protein [Sphingomonas zeae]